jgi:hypothetical protein
MTDTNAGPVLPELPYLTGLLANGQQDRIEAYGRQCWNACDEQVAGPLRQALSECATAVGAGAAPDCSVEFLRQVPREVELVVARLRERVAELERLVELYRVQWVEREWMKHPQTIEAKAQWDAVASALGADKNCPDSVLSAAHRLRAENEALRADAERARWVIANAEWHRSEDRTYMAILVPRGSDLSCVAFRRDAIDAARAAREGK